MHEERLKQAMKRVKQIRNNAGAVQLKKFQDTIALFRKYGEQYDFDPLMLAAQAYQQSQLNQKTENYFGAIGVMQIMPTTGEALKVGDIRAVEPNIHGGVKYMNQLMASYFEDAAFNETNRTLFAWLRVTTRTPEYREDEDGGGAARTRPEPTETST